ncbi:type II secretion system protein [Rheinheimera sp.]|uniref:PilW family protein n=1 Tax=Rheinheimera sp. TaxID=1869214 RepID=UPI00307CD7B5
MGKQSAGFTLLELIFVVVLLGIVSAATFSYLGTGARMYADAADREELLSKSRFAVERLTRELRNVVPNSVRVSDNGYCIEFAPLVKAGRYSSSLNSGTTSLFSPAGWGALFPSPPPTLFMTVYPLDAQADIYNRGKVVSTGAGLSFASYTPPNPSVTVNFTAPVTALSSASQRMYFFTAPVVYCVRGTELHRYQRTALVSSAATAAALGAGMPMAANLSTASNGFYNRNSVAPFSYNNSVVLTRNAVVQMRLAFVSAQNDELVFNQEIHIPNVP